MQNVYKNIDEYNPVKKRKILIVFDDMIADTINNKNLNSIMTGLFIRGRKVNISLAFISYSFLFNDATLETDNPLIFRKVL